MKAAIDEDSTPIPPSTTSDHRAAAAGAAAASAIKPRKPVNKLRPAFVCRFVHMQAGLAYSSGGSLTSPPSSSSLWLLSARDVALCVPTGSGLGDGGNGRDGSSSSSVKRRSEGLGAFMEGGLDLSIGIMQLTERLTVLEV